MGSDGYNKSDKEVIRGWNSCVTKNKEETTLVVKIKEYGKRNFKT